MIDRKEVTPMMDRPDIFLKSLYEAQYEKMFKLAYRMIGSTETAQDLVQEAFLIALFHRDELTTHPLPEGWLMLTLKNLVLNERRRIKNHPEVALESIAELSEAPPDTSLDMLLPKKLSTEDRKVLIWRFEQQIEYREMADRLGISEVGCRSRVSRAIAHCKKLLGSS